MADVGTTCLCIDLRSAANRLTRAYDEALAPAGITVTQFSQLNTIRAQGRPTLGALADATGLDRSTLGRNVRLLEKQGLVAISPGEDARTRTLQLTKAGESTFRRALPLWYATQKDLVERIGEDGRSQLDALLAVLTATASGQNTEATGAA